MEQSCTEQIVTTALNIQHATYDQNAISKLQHYLSRKLLPSLCFKTNANL